MTSNTPIPPDDRCGTCRLDVTYDEKGVCCDECDRWYHIGCEGISDLKYTEMQNSQKSGTVTNVEPPQAITTI